MIFNNIERFMVPIYRSTSIKEHQALDFIIIVSSNSSKHCPKDETVVLFLCHLWFCRNINQSHQSKLPLATSDGRTKPKRRKTEWRAKTKQIFFLYDKNWLEDNFTPDQFDTKSVKLNIARIANAVTITLYSRVTM